MATNTPIKYSPYEKEGYKIDLSAEQIESALKTINLAISTGQLDDKTLQDINAIIQTVVEWDVSDDSLSVKEQLINIYNSMLSQDEYNDLKPNIIKNPNALDGDVVETHLTVGHRTGDAGATSFVSGGNKTYPNEASGEFSASVGGASNSATGTHAVVVGGNSHRATTQWASIFGGSNNIASAILSAIINGYNSEAVAYLSTVLGSQDSKAISPRSVIIGGQNNIAGGKAYKIIGVSDANEDGTGTYTLQTVVGLEVGMEYSVSLENYRCCPGTIIEIDIANNTVTVDGYERVELDTTDDNYLHITGHPELGDIDIGNNSLSAGENTQAISRSAFAGGRDNIALGKYSTTFGRENIAGYGALAGGRYVKALGDYSLGYGLYVDVLADNACGIGVRLITNKEYQTVMGKFNAENTNAMFVVGNGNHSGRKNIFEVLDDGRATVASNPLNPMDVATKEYVDGMLSGGLENLSWEAISNISKSGKADGYFSIGDTKTISIDGTAYTVRIVDFNKDAVADVNYGRETAGITFELTGVLDETYSMNDTGTNVGGWSGSKMRNEILPSILSQLSENLQSVIVPVTKITDTGYGDGGSLEAAQNPVESVDSLFLLSEKEVLGDSAKYSVCGEQYEYYKDTNEPKKNNKTWWLRSPVSIYKVNTVFCHVISTGETNNQRADIKQSVSFAFCV